MGCVYGVCGGGGGVSGRRLVDVGVFQQKLKFILKNKNDIEENNDVMHGGSPKTIMDQ